MYAVHTLRICCHHLATAALWVNCWWKSAKWLEKDRRQARQQLPDWAAQFRGEPEHAGHPQKSGAASRILVLDWSPGFDSPKQSHCAQSIADWRGSTTRPGECAAWCRNSMPIYFETTRCFPIPKMIECHSDFIFKVLNGHVSFNFLTLLLWGTLYATLSP